MDSEVHITLVHGTFTKRRGWLQTGSALRHHLESTLSARVSFHPFAWSGLPSQIARDRAGRRLGFFLTQVISSNPTAMHFVIAHSHGGNVALYALRDQELASKIEGVVTLSTPFLIARARSISRAGAYSLFAAAVGIGTALGFWVAQFLVRLIEWVHRPIVDMSWFEHLIIGPGEQVGAAVWAVVVGATMGLYAIFVSLPKLVAKNLLETMSLPKLRPDQLFVIRGPSDEANAFLVALQAFALLSSTFWSSEKMGGRSVRRVLSRWLHWFLRKQSIFHLVVSSFGIAAVTALIAVWGLTVGVIYILGILVTGLFMLFIVPELALVAAFVSISIEPSPPGSYKFLQIRGTEVRKLWHSITYVDPEALHAIEEWIMILLTKRDSA